MGSEFELSQYFKLADKVLLDEIKGSGETTGYVYEHISGARVIHIKNGDVNKVFTAIFKTPPVDNTGLPHIMEHCVLAGSEKYTVKEPFNELLKGSLYTFLNAMTYPDKTMYPVASYNDKDFFNLMDVYLDAVFFPKVFERKESFLQEAWCLEIDNGSGDGDLRYNGIVYNEMKGAYSDPNSLIFDDTMRALFPEACYRFDAGGNPDFIPELSYEKFLEFHKKYYTPENCFLYFYGDMDIEVCFERLHNGYLSRFERSDSEIRIEWQKPFDKPVFVEKTYGVIENEGKRALNYLSAGFVVGNSADLELFWAFYALTYILMDTEASPLVKALKERGIGENVTGFFCDDTVQAFFNIVVQNSEFNAEYLCGAVKEILTELVRDGIDKGFIESCFNYLEFGLKEEDFGRIPKGLAYLMRASNIIYGSGPFDRLSPLAALGELRCKAQGRYFEELIENRLLNNPHAAFVTLSPDSGLEERKERELRLILSEKKEKLSGEELNGIIKENADLKKYQETPDSDEALAGIPMVGLPDLKKEVSVVPLEVCGLGEFKVLYSPLDTNGIVYADFYFNTDGVRTGLLGNICVLTHLTGKLDTQNYSFEKLSGEISGRLGGLEVDFGVNDIPGGFMPFIKVSVKALQKNTDMVFKLVDEIVNRTLFDDVKRIKVLLTEIKAQFEDGFLVNGYSIGNSSVIRRAVSYVSDKYRYNEFAGGIEAYKYVKSVLNKLENGGAAAFEQFRNSLLETVSLIFNRKRFTLSCTFGDGFSEFCRFAEGFYNGLSNGNDGSFADLDAGTKKEGFITASKVQYNVSAANFISKGYAFDGGMAVLNKVLTDGYLMDKIRLKGGAYGCGSEFMRNGDMFMFSYRDPKLKTSYEVYAEAAEFISKFDAGSREMLRYVLGAVNVFDRPVMNKNKGEMAVVRYFAGVTDEMRQAEREQMMAVEPNDIRGYAALLEECIANENICTFGNEAEINLNREMFITIEKI